MSAGPVIGRRPAVRLSTEAQDGILEQLEAARAFIDLLLAGHVAPEDVEARVRLIHSRTEIAMCWVACARFRP